MVNLWISLAKCIVLEDNEVGSNAVKLISLGCPELRRLELPGCGIDDAGVTDLHRLGRLEELDLSHNAAIHDWSLIQSLPRLSRLRSLWLCGNGELRGLFLPVALGHCSELGRLGLGGIGGVEMLRLATEALLQRRRRLLVVGWNDAEPIAAELITNSLLHGLPLSFDWSPCPGAPHPHFSLPSFPLPASAFYH